MSHRVLHVLSGMNRGGIETWLMNVLRRVEGHRIHFDFMVEAQAECAYDQEIVGRGGRVFRGPRFRHRIQASRALAAVLRRQGPYAVLHAHGRHDMAWPVSVAAALRVPVRIGHVHNLKDGHDEDPVRRAYKRVSKAVLLRTASWILGCSTRAVESLYGPGITRTHEHMRMLPYGIDMDRFVRQATRERIGDELDIPAHAKIAGHVGRMVWEKNHVFLVEVFGELVRRDPDWVLVLVGDGPLRPEVERELASRGLGERVRFTGVRSDVPELMSAMDVMVFPSLLEGFGLVLVEAQALGLPCVIAQTIPEDVDVDAALIARVPLAAGAGPWADAVIRAAMTPDRSDEAHALVATSHFNIERSVELLLRKYYNLGHV